MGGRRLGAKPRDLPLPGSQGCHPGCGGLSTHGTGHLGARGPDSAWDRVILAHGGGLVGSCLSSKAIVKTQLSAGPEAMSAVVTPIPSQLSRVRP